KTFMKIQMLAVPQILTGVLALALLAGCKTPVGVTQVSPYDAYQQINANVLVGETPSDATVVVLHRLMLTEEFKWHPKRAMSKLLMKACAEKNRDILFALSELNYLTGQRLNAERLAASSPKAQAERPSLEDPQPYYLASTLFA